MILPRTIMARKKNLILELVQKYLGLRCHICNLLENYLVEKK